MKETVAILNLNTKEESKFLKHLLDAGYILLYNDEIFKSLSNYESSFIKEQSEIEDKRTFVDLCWESDIVFFSLPISYSENEFEFVKEVVNRKTIICSINQQENEEKCSKIESKCYKSKMVKVHFDENGIPEKVNYPDGVCIKNIENMFKELGQERIK